MPATSAGMTVDRLIQSERNLLCNDSLESQHRDALPLGYHAPRFGFMQDEAFERIERMGPRRLLQHAHRVGVSGLPTEADAARAEIDVFRMILSRQRRRQQPHHMHAGDAAIGGERAYLG